MKKAEPDELRPSYQRSDFPTLERGKYHKEAIKGASVVLIEPELAKSFPTSQAVNEALRGLLSMAEQTSRLTGKKPPRATKRRAA